MASSISSNVPPGPPPPGSAQALAKSEPISGAASTTAPVPDAQQPPEVVPPKSGDRARGQLVDISV